jgi:hypothetical protein
MSPIRRTRGKSGHLPARLVLLTGCCTPDRLWRKSLPHVMDDVPGVQRSRKLEVFMRGESLGGLFPRPAKAIVSMVGISTENSCGF